MLQRWSNPASFWKSSTRAALHIAPDYSRATSCCHGSERPRSLVVRVPALSGLRSTGACSSWRKRRAGPYALTVQRGSKRFNRPGRQRESGPAITSTRSARGPFRRTWHSKRGSAVSPQWGRPYGPDFIDGMYSASCVSTAARRQAAEAPEILTAHPRRTIPGMAAARR